MQTGLEAGQTILASLCFPVAFSEASQQTSRMISRSISAVESFLFPLGVPVLM